jgi:ATP-dependent DNA helicase RecG
MDTNDILKAIDVGEGVDVEFKLAAGGLPGSLWESYSAMANTDGGVVALGVADDGTVRGVPDPGKAQADLWNCLNNRQKVSANLLSNADVRIHDVEGRSVIAVRVPRATRSQRPVYVGPDPLSGTFRRNFEGDYRCTPEEVRRMLADAADQPSDARILEGFTLDDLDSESLQQYRNRFSHRAPTHPWLAEDNLGFLSRLGAWRRDRRTGQEGLTVAGLLMFGRQDTITSPEAVPQYHVDFRERLSDDPAVRWTDRLTLDGTWAGGLFQFYQRALPRLTRDLKVPFKLTPDLFRQDDTPVHEAIREALVNALVHADYRGSGGIVVERFRDRFEFSNPGTLLVSFDQLLRGGVSECRNKSLQLMFQMIGGGEKAGSGMDKIRQGWEWGRWRAPRIREQVQPDRVALSLSMVSLLPPESIDRLRGRLGTSMDRLTPEETQALVTAEVEGSVSNSRLQELTHDHPADITQMLQGLVTRRLLAQKGRTRGTYYMLPDHGTIGRAKDTQPSVAGSSRMPGDTQQLSGDITGTPGDSQHLPGDFQHLGQDSTHRAGDFTHRAGDSTHKAGDSAQAAASLGMPGELERLARTVAATRRVSPQVVRQTVIELCRQQPLTAQDLGRLLKRNSRGLRERYLRPMLEEKLLRMEYPNEPNRPDQAYTTNERSTEL